MPSKKLFGLCILEVVFLVLFYVSGTFYGKDTIIIYNPSTIIIICIFLSAFAGVTVTFSQLKKDDLLKSIFTPAHAIVGGLLILSVVLCGTMAAEKAVFGPCSGTFSFGENTENAHLTTEDVEYGNKTTNKICWTWMGWGSVLLFSAFIVGILEFTIALDCVSSVRRAKSSWDEDDLDGEDAEFNEDDFL